MSKMLKSFKNVILSTKWFKACLRRTAPTNSVTMLRGRLAAAGAGVLVGAAAALAAPALRDKLKPKWSHPLGMHE
jgi:hypothetical protein